MYFVNIFIFLNLDEENWRNKNKPVKKILKSRRAIHSMLNPSVQIVESIMLLKNGHLSYRGKQSIRTFNTCPFDSFFAVVAAMYSDHDEIKNQINQLAPNSEFLSMIYDMFNDDSKTAVKYNALLRERNILLSSIFEAEVYDCGLRTVDCQANVNYIIPKLLPQEMYSYIREKQCDRCGEQISSKRCFVDIDIDKLEAQPIENLNSCLLDTIISEQPSKCSCNGVKRIVNTNFSNFIMIDLTLKESIKWLSLCKLPTELNILGIKFSLKACVELIGANNAKITGHYISHVYRRNARWEMYDDKKSQVLRSNTTNKIQGQALFYVRVI